MQQLSKEQQSGDNITLSFQKPSLHYRVRFWISGLIILVGLIIGVTHFGEIEHFILLMRKAKPVWLLYGVFLQTATYFSLAAAWYRPLRHAGTCLTLLSLVPMGIAKLFSDQALPSAGMSGTAFFVAALNRRGIPVQLCMATLLMNLVVYYMAFLLVAITSVVLLWCYHDIHTWMILITILFCIVSVVIPFGALWIRNWSKKSPPLFLMRIPGLKNMFDALGNSPDYLLRDGRLFTETMFYQLAIFLLDAATLWVVLCASGQYVSYLIVFPCFIIAAMVSSILPIPLGLGVFETTCVLMLGSFNVPHEAALTSTLMFRGYTMWLPMLPGMWLTRRAFSKKTPSD